MRSESCRGFWNLSQFSLIQNSQLWTELYQLVPLNRIDSFPSRAVSSGIVRLCSCYFCLVDLIRYASPFPFLVDAGTLLCLPSNCRSDCLMDVCLPLPFDWDLRNLEIFPCDAFVGCAFFIALVFVSVLNYTQRYIFHITYAT